MAEIKSRESLLSFLDYSKEKGLLSPSTAEARKAAVNQVLGILNDTEAADVSKLDMDALLRRFQNLHGRRYTPESLKTYRARVRISIDEFLRYTENPMDFQPSSKSPVKRVKAPRIVRKGSLPGSESSAVAVSRPTAPMPISTATLPIPLRHDLTVLIHGLPYDLTAAEAKKIANVIQAMAAPSA